MKHLLENGTVDELPLKAATISDLKSLCLALLDNVNDKSLALSHQKKTNKYDVTKEGDFFGAVFHALSLFLPFIGCWLQK